MLLDIIDFVVLEELEIRLGESTCWTMNMINKVTLCSCLEFISDVS